MQVPRLILCFVQERRCLISSSEKLTLDFDHHRLVSFFFLTIQPVMVSSYEKAKNIIASVG